MDIYGPGLVAGLDSIKEKLQPFETPHPYWVKQMAPERWGRYRALQDALEDSEDKKSYLPQYPYERSKLYENRIKITHYLGICEMAIERLVGAIFDKEPNFTSESDQVMEWIADIDGNGTSLRDFMESTSAEANWMSAAYVVATKIGLRPDQEQPESQAQEAAAGLNKPVLERLTVEEVPSWGRDENDNISWIAVCQYITRQASPTDEPKSIQRWRVFTSETIEVWERELKDDGSAVDGGEELKRVGTFTHKMGQIPIARVPAKHKGKMEADSFIKGGSRADLAKLQEDSAAAAGREKHAHPFLAVKSPREMQAIVTGGDAMRLEPDEDAAYIEAPSGVFAIRADAADSFLRQGIMQTGSNPSMVQEPGTRNQESGAAQRVRFSHTERRHISRHTRALQSATSLIMTFAQMILEDLDANQVEKSENSAQFFNNFEGFDLAETISAYNDSSPSIDSPTYHREMQKKIAVAAVGDVPQPIVEAIKDEIDTSEGNNDDPDSDFR